MNRFGEMIQKIRDTCMSLHHYLEVIEVTMSTLVDRGRCLSLSTGTEVADGGAESAGNFILFDEG